MGREDKFERMNGFEDSEGEMTPEEIVTRAFSRCSNWPKERVGVLGLAQGLKTAASRYSVAMEAIVRECVDVSTFCPTDTDLLNVARGLAPVKETPPAGRRKTCPFEICDGSGWKESFALHTTHAGDGTRATWIQKENITEEQYRSLSVKVDWKLQRAYSARSRCQCHPAKQEEIEKRGRYA